MPEINTLAEKIALYRYLKERMERLKEIERQAEMPMPEQRENIALAVVLLEKIRSEMEAEPLSTEELKRKIFSDWESKVLATQADENA